MITAEHLSSQELNFLAETFRLLGDPSRLKILLHCEDGPKSVTDISEALELSQSLVSHHLRLLRGARLVTRVRHSKQMFYEVSVLHSSGWATINWLLFPPVALILVPLLRQAARKPQD